MSIFNRISADSAVTAAPVEDAIAVEALAPEASDTSLAAEPTAEAPAQEAAPAEEQAAEAPTAETDVTQEAAEAATETLATVVEAVETAEVVTAEGTAATTAAAPEKDPLDNVVETPKADDEDQSQSADATVVTEEAPVAEAAASEESMEAPVQEVATATAETPTAVEAEATVVTEAETAPEQAEPVVAEAEIATEAAAVVAEEAPAQEASPAEAPTAEADIAVESIEMTVTPRFGARKTQAVLQTLETWGGISRRTTRLIGSLRNLEMVTNFAAVAQEHQLSAPVVAAFRATPDFEAAVESFPSTTTFNIIPEHQTSPENVAGLEAFGAAEGTVTSDLSVCTSAVISDLGTMLDGMSTTVISLQEQLDADKDALAGSDVTDEVMATLPVFTMSGEAFLNLLTKLEEQLKSVDVFNADHLVANPEKLQEEADALSSLISEIGGALGLNFNYSGMLVEIDKSDEFAPSNGTFEDKAITKSALIFLADKASEILSVLKVVADAKGDIIDALNEAVNNMPTAVNSDDVTYGCSDHATLIGCYSVLLGKLVRESVLAVTMVLSTLDAVVDIEGD